MGNLPILYSFRRCPYAMRTRIFITLCQIDVEIRERSGGCPDCRQIALLNAIFGIAQLSCYCLF